MQFQHHVWLLWSDVFPPPSGRLVLLSPVGQYSDGDNLQICADMGSLSGSCVLGILSKRCMLSCCVASYPITCCVTNDISYAIVALPLPSPLFTNPHVVNGCACILKLAHA
jgi:hypothetical protein